MCSIGDREKYNSKFQYIYIYIYKTPTLNFSPKTEGRDRDMPSTSTGAQLACMQDMVYVQSTLVFSAPTLVGSLLGTEF